MARRCIIRVHPGCDWDHVEEVYYEEKSKNHRDDSGKSHPRKECARKAQGA